MLSIAVIADDIHGFLPSLICEQSCQIPQHYAGRLGEVLCLHRGANHAVHWGCQTSQRHTWSASIQSANNGLLLTLQPEHSASQRHLNTMKVKQALSFDTLAVGKSQTHSLGYMARSMVIFTWCFTSHTKYDVK